MRSLRNTKRGCGKNVSEGPRVWLSVWGGRGWGEDRGSPRQSWKMVISGWVYLTETPIGRSREVVNGWGRVLLVEGTVRVETRSHEQSHPLRKYTKTSMVWVRDTMWYEARGVSRRPMHSLASHRYFFLFCYRQRSFQSQWKGHICIFKIYLFI